jgi:hypothetical protein
MSGALLIATDKRSADPKDEFFGLELSREKVVKKRAAILAELKELQSAPGTAARIAASPCQ